MTPTLFGRWQTRIFLLGTYGVLVSLFFGWLFNDGSETVGQVLSAYPILASLVSLFGIIPGLLDLPGSYLTVLSVIGYVCFFGFFWDMLYNFMQQFRWDSDWPPTHQFGAAVVEIIFLWIILFVLESFLPPIPGVGRLGLFQLLFHYWTVWIVIFLLSQSAMRVWFPRWRYNGGEIV